MNQQGSYRISTIASSAGKEIQRLKAQIDLFWDKELKHYIEYGLRDTSALVELGSGPGFGTAKILEHFPSIQVTAVEVEPLFIEYARGHLSSNDISRCEIVQKSIMETGLPANTFDFALTRMVLEHLPDPVAAVREIGRILKPGGRAVFVDNDFDMHIMTSPHIAILKELYEAYCQSRYAEGGNPKIGRELPGILKRGDLALIDFEVICAHSDVVGLEIFLNSEGISIPSKLVHDGFLSSKALAQISVEWRNMMKSEQHSILRQLYLAVGEKRS